MQRQPGYAGCYVPALRVAQRASDRVERVSPQERRVDRLHRLGLVRDDLAARPITEGPHTLRGPPLLSALKLSPRLTSPLALHLGTGHGRLDPGVHPAAVGAQICVPVGRHEEQAPLLGPVDPVLQLTGRASEAAEVIDHDGVDKSGLVVGHHPLVCGTLLGAVRGRDRLIHVRLYHIPAAVPGQVLAVLALALDGQPVHLAVE